jgi:hypothetical protein
VSSSMRVRGNEDCWNTVPKGSLLSIVTKAATLYSLDLLLPGSGLPRTLHSLVASSGGNSLPSFLEVERLLREILLVGSCNPGLTERCSGLDMVTTGVGTDRLNSGWEVTSAGYGDERQVMLAVPPVSMHGWM